VALRLKIGLDPVTRGWAVVTSAGVLRLGFGFVASLVVARALGPTNFGIYAVLAAAVGIVNTLAEGGLTEAAVLRIAPMWSTNGRDAEVRARAFFWLRMSLVTAIVLVGCALASVIAARLLEGVDDGLLRLALIGVIATAASGALSAMLQATGAFGRMSSLTLINTSLTAALALVLAFSQRLDLVAALVVLGIGTSLATFVAARAMLPKGWRLDLPSRADLVHEATSLFQTGRWLWLASLFATFTANAEVLLLNRWAALPLVGAYALALNLASKADVVNQSLYTVLLPGVATLEDQQSRRSYVRRGLVRSGAIAVGLLALIPLAEPVIVIIYGQEFAQTAVFFRLLVGIVIFDVLLAPLLLLPLAYRRPKLMAAADAARAITLIVAGVALIPTFGAFGAILARFGARIGGASVVLASLYSGRTAPAER
jgi:O-antigen/teichoic acid export membrane protein